MDYPNRRRIKIWVRAEVVENDAALLALLADPESATEVERAFVIHVEAWDANCPQHTTPRFGADQVEAMGQTLRLRIAELEAAVGVEQYLLGFDLGEDGLWLPSRTLRLLARRCWASGIIRIRSGNGVSS